MKRHFILCLLAASSLMISGCEDILDKEPTDKLSLEETFRDLEGVKTALSGAYTSLLDQENYRRNLMIYPELASGNLKYSKTRNLVLEDLYTFSQTSIESSGNATYTGLYSTLNNINNIIKYTPATLYASEQEKNRILAEAKAMRALVHFELSRLFAKPYTFTPDAAHAGIVVNLQPRLYSDPLPQRATIAQTYEAILNDLNEALVLFGKSSPVFSGGNAKAYFSPNAVKALLAKVYLYKGEWTKAYQFADEVIGSKQYQLLAGQQYVSSWDSKTPNAETIFELALKSNFTGTSLGNYYTPGFTENMFAATQDLLSLYSPTDLRGKESMFVAVTAQNETFYYTKKYGRGGANSTNIKLLRLSELYLIRAEAAAELGNLPQANQDLGTVQQRADAAAVAPEHADKGSLLEAILLERRKELAFEGNLFHDLRRRKQNITRTDCAAPLCSLPFNDPRLVLPLPKATTDVNPDLTQNEGY